jgi:hypothetical protein
MFERLRHRVNLNLQIVVKASSQQHQMSNIAASNIAGQHHEEYALHVMG